MKDGLPFVKGKIWLSGTKRVKESLLGFYLLFSETKWISFQRVWIKMEFFLKSWQVLSMGMKF